MRATKKQKTRKEKEQKRRHHLPLLSDRLHRRMGERCGPIGESGSFFARNGFDERLGILKPRMSLALRSDKTTPSSSNSPDLLCYSTSPLSHCTPPPPIYTYTGCGIQDGKRSMDGVHCREKKKKQIHPGARMLTWDLCMIDRSRPRQEGYCHLCPRPIPAGVPPCPAAVSCCCCCCCPPSRPSLS